MADIQYKRNDFVLTPLGMIDLGYSSNNLIVSGTKTTSGAPTATAKVYEPSCLVNNIADGLLYQNTGTTASPVWSAVPTGASAFSLPSTETDSTTTTGTSIAWAFSALTSGIAMALTAVGLTTGKIYRAIAAAATLTTGRYFEAFDGVIAVWGIGANGHIHTAQTTAPTIAVTTQNGITAAAITAGASDTCGIITTTGTNNAGGSTVLDVSFNKTYTTAPKAVALTPRNASAAKAAATSLALPYVSAISATGFTVTIPSDASAGATPSFQYLVVA